MCLQKSGDTGTGCVMDVGKNIKVKDWTVKM